MFEAASNIARRTDGVFYLSTAICIALLLVITLLMLYFVVRYRRSASPEAAYIEGNAPLEYAWTIGGIVLVMFLFYIGWGGYKLRADVPEDAVVVEATAQMWSWSFEYPGGVQTDKLVVPVGRPVKVVLRSRDVLHSLYIPAFRVKQDVVPGSEHLVWFTPDAPGEYQVFCTEYCGTGHSHMLTKAVAVLPEEFEERTRPAAAGPSGEELYRLKGCSSCHTIDGTPLIGPSWKSIYGHKVKVITDGAEREVVVDEDYLRRSMLSPNADIVAGFPPIMPSQQGVLTDSEIDALVEFIKSLE